MGLRREVLRQQGRDTIFLGQPGVGQGKLTGLLAIEQQLTNPLINTRSIDIVRLDPSKGKRSTQLKWYAVRKFYDFAGKYEVVGRIFSQSRSETAIGKKILSFFNKELHEALALIDDPFLTMHGMYGKATERFPRRRNFAEMDARAPEHYAVDASTFIFAPTHEVANAYVGLGQKRNQLLETGHILPQELLDSRRQRERISMFSQKEPTTDKPLRITFMMTGQLAHMNELRTLLGDERINTWIREGKAQLDVYLFTGRKQAQKIAREATKQHLNPKVTTTYDPHSQTGVQLFWNKNPDTAVRKKFTMAGRADYLIAPPAEYVGWFAAIPGEVLDPIPGNRKMETNKAWLIAQRLIDTQEGTFGEKIQKLFSEDGRHIQRFYEHSNRVARTTGLHGAEKIARRMLAQVTSR
ncbi:MAG TPA: hypothetical protein VLF20_04820 [Patescibacteria group bacterium]|nr:hypothetical protein [Patescibacteria group bacterium]